MKKIIYLIPLYNKENVLENTFKSLKSFSIDKINIHFLFVENGSNDKSLQKLNKLIKKDDNFSVITSEKGMGIAIKTGMKFINSNFDTKNTLLVITGADLPFGFSDYENCLSDYSYGTVEIFIGSKTHKKTSIDRKISRILFSKIFNILLKLFFKIDIGDTQGTFIIDLDKVDLSRLFPKSYGFFATAEICILAKEENYQISEIPVTQQFLSHDKSTVKIIRDTIFILREMLVFRFLLKK